MRLLESIRPNLHAMICLAVCAFVCLIAGCSSGEKSGASGGVTTSATEGAFVLDDNVRSITLLGEAWRLPQDVERAAIAMEWGRLVYDVQPKQPRYEPRTWDGVVRLHALLPDDRRAIIIAQSADSDPKRVALRIRVGTFGNALQERRFAEALQDALNKPAKPVRGWGFELPTVRESP